MVARNKAETHYKSFIHFLKGSALRNCRTMPRLTWYSVTLTQRQRRRAWEDQAVIGVMLPEAKEDCGHGSCKRQGLSLRPSGRSMALLTLCRPLLSEPRENRTPAALSQLAVLLCYCRPQKLRLNSLMLSHFSRKSQFSSVQTLNCVHLFATPWTAACQILWALWTRAHQAPLSMGFSRQESWSGLPFHPPGDLPDPGIELGALASPALVGEFFTTSATWGAQPHSGCLIYEMHCVRACVPAR